jgi:hypothetical protein
MLWQFLTAPTDASTGRAVVVVAEEAAAMDSVALAARKPHATVVAAINASVGNDHTSCEYVRM